MLYGPDYSDSDSDGFSDDNDYENFKARIKAINRRQAEPVDTEEEKWKRLLRTVFSAVTYEKADTVFEELDKGLDVDIDLDLGWSPLLLAATTANESIISGLIERGANINQTRDSTTPLMYLCSIPANDESAEEKILSCVKLLVDKKVDINLFDKKRRTAIMMAANNGHLDTVKFLLPLVDKEAEDNQQWNVLFYAVDGNHPKIVEFLLSQNISHEKTDLRSNTPADLAHSNDFHEISDLFPKDPFDEVYAYMNNNDFNFEGTFSTLKKNEKPHFLNDVCKILYGTRSELVLPIFVQQKISLREFLSIDFAKLEKLGVKFPYQRNRIIGGIYKFHKHPFKPQSIPFVKKNQLYTNIDVATALLTCAKQLIAMEAGVKFVVDHSQEKLSLPDSKEVNILIAKTRQQVDRLLEVAEKLSKKTKQWDLIIKPVDRITKKRMNIPWSNLCLVVGVGVLSVFILCKSRFAYFFKNLCHK